MSILGQIGAIRGWVVLRGLRRPVWWLEQAESVTENEGWKRCQGERKEERERRRKERREERERVLWVFLSF